MSNNKIRPAAGKSAAGKSNSKKAEREKQKQRAKAEKNAKRVIEEKQKARRQREKRSEEIKKQRAKQSEIEKKNLNKIQQKEKRISRRKLFAEKLKKLWKRIKYYTSKEFLLTINFLKVFVFIVLPLILICFGIHFVSKTVLLNVPMNIRSFEYNSRLESETIAAPSVFNSQQQQVFMDALKASGSRKFEFYMNSVIPIDDNSSTDKLCFGNPADNNCVLIAVIYDSDGNIIYRSLGLECGKEINDAKMFTGLSYGLHDVKVAVNAYDRKTNEKIGTKYAEIKLAVGVDENGK